VHKQPLAKCLLELLLARLAGTATEDQLAPELPAKRNIPVLGRLLIDDGVVVLKVGAKALCLEGDPEGVLVHGVGVFRPVTEMVSVNGESFTEVLDRLGGLVEEDLHGGVSAWNRKVGQALRVVGQLRAPRCDCVIWLDGACV
jgi:hypothetical protein